LNEAGHEAYLVGGGVRDLLLGARPKDFDIATSAKPEEVRALFRNCRLIGRRFRLAHVRFGREIVEVATFRAAHAPHDAEERLTADGRLLSDNVYGTLEEDAARRDFTVNCLYYDVRDFSVLDFADAMSDLRAGVLRMIGEPETRYREDPVRILRVVRFSAKLGFRPAPETEAPIRELSTLLGDIPPARLFEEMLKLLTTGHAEASLEALRRYDVLRYLFPQTASCIERGEDRAGLELVEQAMRNTDARLALDKPVTPGFLLAALLWPPLRAAEARLVAQGLDPRAALEQAAGEVISAQAERVALPKRFSLMAREIWSLQSRLEGRDRHDAVALLGHPRFRAAYDFLLLRAEAGEPVAELAQWWTELQALDGEEREAAIAALPRTRRRRRGPRRRGKRVA